MIGESRDSSISIISTIFGKGFIYNRVAVRRAKYGDILYSIYSILVYC